MSLGLTTADRLAATRAQLDALAHALGRVDIEAIEASAQALAHLVGDLAPPAAAAQRAAGPTRGADADLPSVDDLRDLQWRVERCRRLGALPARFAVPAEPTASYRPDGQPAPAERRMARLEVAG